VKVSGNAKMCRFVVGSFIDFFAWDFKKIKWTPSVVFIDRIDGKAIIKI
jgi:hypothetical protein